MPNYKRYYIDNHCVFITVVTYNRRPILIKNINLLKNCIERAKQKYKFKIIAIAVLHDHFHILLQPNYIKDFSNIIGSIKKYFSYNYKEGASNDAPYNDSRDKRQEKYIWQRRFYEHTIRDEQDLNKHTDYIHYNPMKHYHISPKNWEYSSFRNFVKLGFYDENWCNYGDINKISDLDYE